MALGRLALAMFVFSLGFINLRGRFTWIMGPPLKLHPLSQWCFLPFWTRYPLQLLQESSAQHRQHEQKMEMVFGEWQQKKDIKLGLLVLVVGIHAEAAVPPPCALKGSQLSCNETRGLMLC